MRRLALASLAVIGLPAAQALAQSCAMCGSSFGGADDPLQRAFSWSILFLMAAPYTLFATAAGFIFYKYRRAGRPRAAVIPLSWRRRPAGQPGGH
jgi:hypothetical protein